MIISVSAAGTDTLLPESARPIPTSLAGPFGSTGLNIGHAGLIAVLLVMLGSYVLAVRGAGAFSARTVLASIAGLHALMLLAPPLLSTDVFSYLAYSRMGALYGANPYLQGPHAIALDPLYPFIGAKWAYTPSAYGPLFTALSYPIAPLGIAASVASYKAIAAVASLVLVALVWNAARLRGVDPVKASALVGLNPLLVVYGVGGAHNDLLMLAVMMAGVYLLLQRRERAGGGLMMTAVGFKLTAGLLLPFALAGATARRRRGVLVGASVAAALVVGVGLAMFGTGAVHLLSTVQQSQASGDWHSIPGFLGRVLGLGHHVAHVPGLVLAALFVAVFGWLVRRVWIGELDWIAGAAWATAALLVTATSLLPWYVAWLLPLVALTENRRLWMTAIILTVVVQGIQLVGYVPHLPGL